jgi:hypothetical protein
MNQSELLLCGHVVKRFDIALPLWKVLFTPKLAKLEVETEDGDRTSFTMNADNCYGIKVGTYVRIKRTVRRTAYTMPESHLFAFTAPAPKPHVTARGYLLRFTKGGARIRLEDKSVVEVERYSLRGTLREGSAVQLVKYCHGSLDQYCDRYVEVDPGRQAFAGPARDIANVTAAF